MKVKSGWSTNREVYSDMARALFKLVIQSRRAKVSLPGETTLKRRLEGLGGETFQGWRFHDDSAILPRVESYFTEAEFLAEPIRCIDAALIDAARSDHYYEFEKDYGGPEIEDMHEDDGIEDGRD